MSLLKFAATVLPERPAWQRPYTATLGRLISLLPTTMLQHDPSISFKSPDPEMMDEEADRVEELYKSKMGDKYRARELQIHPNSTRTIEDIKRIWTNKKINPLTKILGTLGTPLINFSNSLGRENIYNPLSETATIFSKAPGIAARAAGMHTDLGNSRVPLLRLASRGLLVPHITQHGRAASRAVESTDSLAEKAKMRRYLYPEVGAYAGMGVGGLAGGAAGSLIGQGTSMIQNKADKSDAERKVLDKKLDKEPSKSKDKGDSDDKKTNEEDDKEKKASVILAKLAASSCDTRPKSPKIDPKGFSSQYQRRWIRKKKREKKANVVKALHNIQTLTKWLSA